MVERYLLCLEDRGDYAMNDKKKDLLEENINKRLDEARYEPVKKRKKSHLREWMMFIIFSLMLLGMLLRYI